MTKSYLAKEVTASASAGYSSTSEIGLEQEFRRGRTLSAQPPGRPHPPISSPFRLLGSGQGVHDEHVCTTSNKSTTTRPEHINNTEPPASWRWLGYQPEPP
jgi:hypothetical protein